MGRAGVEAGREKAREIGVRRDRERNGDGEETGMEPRMSFSFQPRLVPPPVISKISPTAASFG